MDLPDLIKPNGIYISDHHSLMDLGNAVVYAGDALKALRTAVNDYFKDVETAVKENIKEFKQVQQKAQENLSHASEALSACQSQKEYDEDGNEVSPNCSCEQRDVDQAQKELDEINKIVRELENIQTELEKEFFDYREPGGFITPPGGDGVLTVLSEGKANKASNRMQEIVDKVNDYLRVDVRKGTGVSDAPVDSESQEQTLSKAEQFKEASARILQRQKEENYGSRELNAANAVSICVNCHRPIVACICGRDALQHEMIFNYHTR